jgi:hypothetical protein
MTASRLAISMARTIILRPVRRNTGTWCHHIGPHQIRSKQSIFLPGSLEDRGPYRNYLRYRRPDFSWPQSEFVTPTVIVAAGKNDGVAAPLIGSAAHNPVVVRVFLRSVDFHAGTMTLQVLILFLAPISRAAIPAALYVWRLAPVRLV